MALATTCPQCKTSFKVVPDQLKLRRGLVRCGVCQFVFSGVEHLRYVDKDDDADPTTIQHAPDTAEHDMRHRESSQGNYQGVTVTVNAHSKAQLDNFIDPNEKYPAIVTTSKLMTTGVDCKTCKLIVLDNEIKSMTEFKQIIGRGTRINDDYGKQYFTIMDFRNVTNLFADPEFDGMPESITDDDEAFVIDGDDSCRIEHYWTFSKPSS